MFTHSVYFWLKEGLSEEELADCERGLRSLLDIPSIHQSFLGKPASTDRPVIDRSYTWALLVQFANQDDHDAYQVHPLHDDFRVQCEKYWDRVLIYDAKD